MLYGYAAHALLSMLYVYAVRVNDNEHAASFFMNILHIVAYVDRICGFYYLKC